MAGAEEFAWVSAVLSRLTPDADVGAIELQGGGGARRMVTVKTRTPGRLIGRHGTIADAVRAALAERFSDDGLQLNIMQLPEDPARPPGGA